MPKKNTKEHRKGFMRDDNNFGRNRDFVEPKGPRVADPDGSRTEPDQQLTDPNPIPDKDINID
jgi:hypothetical protein